MLNDARRSPFHVCFGAPSCVPATPFDHAGATLDAAGVAARLDRPVVREYREEYFVRVAVILVTHHIEEILPEFGGTLVPGGGVPSPPTARPALNAKL
jgi:adenine deaminase